MTKGLEAAGNIDGLRTGKHSIARNHCVLQAHHALHTRQKDMIINDCAVNQRRDVGRRNRSVSGVPRYSYAPQNGLKDELQIVGTSAIGVNAAIVDFSLEQTNVATKGQLHVR